MAVAIFLLIHRLPVMGAAGLLTVYEWLPMLGGTLLGLAVGGLVIRPLIGSRIERTLRLSLAAFAWLAGFCVVNGVMSAAFSPAWGWQFGLLAALYYAWLLPVFVLTGVVASSRVRREP